MPGFVGKRTALAPDDLGDAPSKVKQVFRIRVLPPPTLDTNIRGSSFPVGRRLPITGPSAGKKLLLGKERGPNPWKARDWGSSAGQLSARIAPSSPAAVSLMPRTSQRRPNLAGRLTQQSNHTTIRAPR